MSRLKIVLTILVGTAILLPACQPKVVVKPDIKAYVVDGNDRVQIFRIVGETKQVVKTDTLINNDEVRVGPGSRAKVAFQENNMSLELRRSATVQLENMKSDHIELNLSNGKMKLVLPPPTDTVRVDIYTPTVITSIRGTEINFDIDQEGRTIVSMEKGIADVTLRSDTTKTYQLNTGQLIVANKEVMNTPRRINIADKKLISLADGLSGIPMLTPDFGQWNNNRITFNVRGKVFEGDNNTEISVIAKQNFGKLATIIMDETKYTYRIMAYNSEVAEEQARQVYLLLVEEGLAPEQISWGAGTIKLQQGLQIEVEYND